MISWPIQALIATKKFDKVFVSTDSPMISKVATQFGATVLLRPDNLADDFTGTTAVLQNAIETELGFLHDQDWVYKVYPTCTLPSDAVRAFIEFTEHDSHRFSVSVGQFRSPVQRAMAMEASGILTFSDKSSAMQRTQDLRPSYFDAGKIYGGPTRLWRTSESPLTQSPRGFVLSEAASVDIDTEADWAVAEALHKRFPDTGR